MSTAKNQKKATARTNDDDKSIAAYPTVDFTDFVANPDNAADLIRKYGVLVVEDVLSGEECNSHMEGIVTCFEKMNPGVLHRNKRDTWIRNNLPPYVRYGLFQSLVGHLPPVWEVRRNPNIGKLFAELYPRLRERSDGGHNMTANNEFNQQESFQEHPYDESMVCSVDGINVQPNFVPQQEAMKQRKGERNKMKGIVTSHDEGGVDPDDWGHVDKTGTDVDIFECLQGQAVLTNTSASFRCTPKSHLHFDTVMEITGFGNSEKNFGKPKLEQMKDIKKRMMEQSASIGGYGSESLVEDWQIPIRAKKGSFILWFSTTIHSAMSSTKKETFSGQSEKIHDPFKGWRGVVYVCYRPLYDFTTGDLERRKQAMTRNRCMDHWCGKEFSVRSRPKNKGGSHCDRIEWFIEDPTRVFDVCGKPSVVTETETS